MPRRQHRNAPMVADMRRLWRQVQLRRPGEVTMCHVRSHTKVPGNELADWLAAAAASKVVVVVVVCACASVVVLVGAAAAVVVAVAVATTAPDTLHLYVAAPICPEGSGCSLSPPHWPAWKVMHHPWYALA